VNAGSRPGLLGSAARLGLSIAGLAENKLQLFASEFESERIWLMRLALRLGITLLALTLASLFAGLWLTWLLWDWNHAMAILAPAFLFAMVGIVCWNMMMEMSAAKPPAFEQTRGELQKDMRSLDAFCGGSHD